MPQIIDGAIPEGTRVSVYYTGVTTGTRSVVLDGRGHRIRPIEAADVVVPINSPNPLTAREDQVLQLVARGLPNREIGDELSISGEAVKTHLRHILAKVGARNRTHLVTRAIRLGLVRLSDLFSEGEPDMIEIEALRARVLAFAAEVPVEQLLQVGTTISEKLAEFAQIRATSEHPALDEVAGLMANTCGGAMDTAEQALQACRSRLEVYAQLL